jgi:hypothetical protein
MTSMGGLACPFEIRIRECEMIMRDRGPGPAA